MGDAGQGANRHLRAEVAAADADVDDVAQAPRRCAVGALAHRLGEGEHRVENRMDLVAERRAAARCTQRRMKHGTAARCC